jgi:hypothetical protein
MSPRVLTARGQHSGKSDGVAVLIDRDSEPAPAYPTCEHPETEPRRRTLSNGIVQLVVQCLRCGRQIKAIRKHEHDLQYAANCNPAFDHTIEERVKAEWQAEFDAWRARREAAWWGRYTAYMASDAWWDRRCRRIELDGYQCRAKLSGCTHHAEQVHHLTYAHLGNEPLFDLISVCTSCHDTITAMDRQRRGTR